MQPFLSPSADSAGLAHRCARMRDRPIEPLTSALLQRLETGRQVMTQTFTAAERYESADLLTPGRARPLGPSSQSGSVDLVELILVPTLSLPQLAQPLAAIAASLRPGGLIMVASLGPATLANLRDLTGLASDQVSELFPDMHDLGDLLVRQGFSAPVLESDRLVMTYSRIERLLADLHVLWPWGLRPNGAQTEGRVTAGGLRPRARLKPLLERLESLRSDDGRIPLAFELVVAHAWRGEPRPSASSDAPKPITLVRKNRFAKG